MKFFSQKHHYLRCLMLEVPKSERYAVTTSQLPPCCLKIHPRDKSVFLVGTYNLEEDGSRYGSIDIYRYDNEQTKMTLVGSNRCESAILDLQFDEMDPNYFASAHSTGEVVLWKIDLQAMTVVRVQKYQVFEEKTLVTSLSFCPSEGRSPSSILATGTSGQAILVDLERQSQKLLASNHDLECWTGCFGQLGQLENVVFTGGDDAKVIAHDLRTQNQIWATNYHHHDAGVVAILSPNLRWNSTNSNHLWTGSYDDNLRILDLRVADKSDPALVPGYIPRVLQQENLGGGVWKLIPSPVPNDDRVMACCMYDGARVVDVGNDGLQQVKRYFKGEHESMCYGGDWSCDGDFIATCSFYDGVIQVWSPDNTLSE